MSFEAVGLRNTTAWMLARKNGLAEVPKRFAMDTKNHVTMKDVARLIVQQVVYATYTPTEYERTYKLMDSISVEGVEGATAQALVFIPIDSGTMAIAGSAAGRATYAKFMLPSHSQNSFFKGRAAASIPRDFMTAWITAFKKYVPDMVMAEVDKELSK